MNRWKLFVLIGLLASGVRAEPAEPSSTPVDRPTAAQQDGAAGHQAEPADSQATQVQSPGQQADQANQANQARQTEQTTVEQRLGQLVQRLSQLPDSHAGRYEIRRQLVELNRNNDKMASIQASGADRLETLGMLAQGQYVQMTRFAEPRLVDRLESQLRMTARRAKAVDDPRAAAVGAFWLMMADLYDINHSDLPWQARQDQAAELMHAYLVDYPQAPAAKGVRKALRQLRTARLNTLIARSPGIAERAGDADQRAMDKLIGALLNRMPIGWWIHDLTVGTVSPTQWQAGSGICMTLERIGQRAGDFKQGRGGVVKLWIMNRDYQPHRTLAEEKQGPRSGVAGELAQWRGRRVYIWGYTANQWNANEVIRAELAATEDPKPPTPPTAQQEQQSSEDGS